MKKSSLVSTLPNLFLFSFFIISISALLSSCDQEIVQASTDFSYVRYEYKFPNGLQRVSPDPDAFGYNIGVFFAAGGAGTSNSSTFFKNQFTNSEFLATNNHGPSYNQNENSELNTSFYNANASNQSSQNIGFTGGLEFIKKGGQGEHLYYLEVPLYATYSVNLNGNGKVFGNLGPYFGYGIGSAFGSNGFKPFDAGASARAGYAMNNSFSFSLGYDYGLVNISNNGGFNNETAANRSISLNIAYPLSKLVKRK